jgi:hypothetical protein
MKTTALRSLSFPPAWPRDPLPDRAAPLAAAGLPRPALPSMAHHDFLVPNPRPDLTLGLQTLRMIQAR